MRGRVSIFCIHKQKKNAFDSVRRVLDRAMSRDSRTLLFPSLLLIQWGAVARDTFSRLSRAFRSIHGQNEIKIANTIKGLYKVIFLYSTRYLKRPFKSHRQFKTSFLNYYLFSVMRAIRQNGGSILCPLFLLITYTYLFVILK